MSEAEQDGADGDGVDGFEQPVVNTRHRDHRFPARGRRITVRLDDAEHEAVVLAAGRAGLTPTGYLGAAALAAATGSLEPAPSETGRRWRSWWRRGCRCGGSAGTSIRRWRR